MYVANSFVAYVKPDSYFEIARRIQELSQHILTCFPTKVRLSFTLFLSI